MQSLSDCFAVEYYRGPPLASFDDLWVFSKPVCLASSLGIAMAGVLLFSGQAKALPTGYQSAAGNVQFQQSGNTLNVTTQATRAVANYQTFNVAQNETVNFNLPSAQSAILNRVVGSNSPSQILGQMNSNGQVFLVNSSGIIFGQSAQLNVGALTASTLSISDQNFLNDQLTFYQSGSPASVVNHGNITALSGGAVNLFAGAIQNSGNISAPNGSVNLAVGSQITMAVGNGMMVEITVD